MKRAKRRDPSAEPFASSLSPEDLVALQERANFGDLTETDYVVLSAESARAIQKTRAAQDDWEINSRSRFSDPAQSASSATAFSEAVFPITDKMYRYGVKDKLNRSAAGRARHTTDLDTREMHSLWRKAVKQIAERRKARSETPLGVLAMVRAVCEEVPGSNSHTVRGYLARYKKQLPPMPLVQAGDWSGLVD